MSVEIISKSGIKILYVDYRECKNADMFIETLYKAAKILEAHPGKLYMLVNIEGVYINSKIVSELKSLVQGVMGEKVHHTVVIGINGVKKILFKAVNTVAYVKADLANSEDEAYEMIASKANVGIKSFT